MNVWHVKWSRGFSRLLVWLSFALVLVGGWAVWSLRPVQDHRQSSSVTTPAKVVRPYAVAVSSRTVFWGNVYWGRYINEWSQKSELKYAYPFSRLNEFHRENYDAWIAGLECPVTAGVNPTAAEEEAALSFNCRPEYLPEAAKWFTAFTLANNHTDNQGAAGFAETQQHLKAQGIQYFGHYDPRDRDNICDVIALPAKVSDSAGQVSGSTIPVAMCAYHGFYMIPPAESIAVITRYAKYMPVIAMPHMGTEYKAAPDQIKTATYRAMIDAGADMVLGDHPHWVQTSEAYNGKPIIYSLGNFIFDQQLRPETTRSAGIEVVMNVDGAERTELAKWLALGTKCAEYHDTCLDRATAQQLKKLPYKFHLRVIGTDNYNKIAKPATVETQAGILSRLDWPETVRGLLPPYSGE